MPSEGPVLYLAGHLDRREHARGVPGQLAVMHSDAIRSRASRATPPKVRVVWQQAELSSLRGIEQWLDSCLSPQMWPLSKSSWRNSALSLNPCGPMSHKSQRVFNIEKRKSSFHTVHREPSTWHCSMFHSLGGGNSLRLHIAYFHFLLSPQPLDSCR